MKLLKLRTKRNPNVIIGILFFLLVLGVEAYSQNDYVVTMKGDTVTGSIVIHQNSNFNIDQLSIRDKGEKRRYFKAIELRFFWFDSSMYRVVKHIDRYQFMIVEMDGYLSLLRYRTQGQNLFNNQLLRKKDGDQLDLPRIGFRKVMANFLSDCPGVDQKINSREYRLSDLRTVILEYNECIENNSNNNLVQAKPLDEDKPDETIDSGRGDLESNAVLSSLEEIKSKFQAMNIESRDFNSIYSDIRQKIINEEAIPQYLIGAFKDSVSQSDEVAKMVDMLVESLPK